MPVGVDHENLQPAVGPRTPRHILRLAALQVPLPGIQIIDPEGIVVAAIVRNDRLLALADDMQLLVGAEAKPGPRKAERRPRYRRQVQNIAIKGHRPLDVGDVNGDVVELGDEQGSEW